MAITTLRVQRRSISVPVPEINGSLKVTANTHTAAPVAVSTKESTTPLLTKFVDSYKELERYQYVSRPSTCSRLLTDLLFRNGQPVTVDGQHLSIAAVTAASRYNATVVLDGSPSVRARMAKSRDVITSKVEAGTSVYGVSTGFGGSADTRTDEPLLLGNALLQHQQSGILPSSSKPLDALPLLDPVASTSMPEAWVRGAILIRMNSLIRGHSGVRLELVNKMNELLGANITPVVPLRGSISASGGLLFTLIQYDSSSDNLIRSLPPVVHCWDIDRKPFDSCFRWTCCFWCS